MIVCCGEALIDMIECTNEGSEKSYIPKVGGAIVNSAIALGRLGGDVSFLGAVSSDNFGAIIKQTIKDSGVKTQLIMTSNKPSTLAFAFLKDGNATYSFFDENSAGKMIEASDFAPIPSEVKAMLFGGISLMSEPCGSSFEYLANDNRDKLIYFDPNIRASFIKDTKAYKKRFETMVQLCDIIKISDDDLAWLYPNTSFESIASEWLKGNTSLAILTKGSEPTIAYTKNGATQVPTIKATVVDTVGAGDTFNAGFLYHLQKTGDLDKQTFAQTKKENIKQAIYFANQVASLVVSKQGANPPYLNEINEQP